MKLQVGVLMVAMPGRFAATARMVEELGFASLIIPDSQNLAPEVWGQLMLAAGATTKLRLGPGVSNSVTRDPALTACSALSLQVESHGRAVTRHHASTHAGCAALFGPHGATHHVEWSLGDGSEHTVGHGSAPVDMGSFDLLSGPVQFRAYD